MKLQLIIVMGLLISNVFSETISKFADYTLEESDTLKADVKVYNGDAIIYGHLDGNLDVYSGDIKIFNKGKVTGTSKAYAGKVYNDQKVDESSSYYVVNKLKNLVLGDDNFFGKKDKENELEIKIGAGFSSSKLQSNNKDGKSFYFHNSAIKKDFFSYSSVEGAYLGLASDISLISSEYADFDFYGSFGYGFKSEDWQYYTDEQLSFFNNILSVGASQYSMVSSEDQWKIDPDMNSASALFIHEDFYNYYLTEGFGFYVGAIHELKSEKTETKFGFKAGYYQDNISEMHRVNDYALFTNSKHFRQVSFYDGNLADKGEIKELLFSGQVISKLSNLNTKINIGGTYERTLDDLEQDFEFQKLSMNFFIETKFSGLFSISNRTRLESCSNSAPNFKYTTLGGNGTLPGYKFNEFSGNRAILSRTMIGFEKFDLLDFRAIFDFGEAYEFIPASSEENLIEGLGKFSTNTLKSSFGLGMVLGDNMMLSIHKRLDTNEDPYQLQFTVKQDF